MTRLINPNKSIKTRFTSRFLRALKQLNNKNRPTCERAHRVKFAANASMAAAVGSKRAWSRAILWKIRNRGMIRRHHALKRSRRYVNKSGNPKRENNFGQTKQLRKLIPGGEDMEIGSLLEETAHYIKCLTTQVQVMKDILDFHSP